MSQDTREGLLSSRVRLEIADLLSRRPRSLKELSVLTNISVQGVLKHLAKLKELGLVSERRVSAQGMGVRKVYSADRVRVGDFSWGDLTVVKFSAYSGHRVDSEDPLGELERLAEDQLVQRRRIRDQTRRLARLIDELAEDQTKMEDLISSLDLADEERLLVQTAFSEESLEDAEEALRRQYGIKEGRRALEKAISKARRVARS